MTRRNLQTCLDSIPYARWLGITGQADSTSRFTLQGDARHVGNPVLNVWHGGVLAGSLQVAMSAALMAAANLDAPPRLYEHTTRYIGSSPITRPLTIAVQIAKLGRRIGFVTAEARCVERDQPFADGNIVASAQASFAGRA